MIKKLLPRRGAVIFCCCCALQVAGAALGDEPIRIVAREQPTNFFGEQEARLRFDVLASEAFEGRVQWRLSAANRTLASRDEAISLEPGKSRAIEVRHKLPPVKEGVVFPLELQIAIVAAKGADPVAELKEPLYLFAANPFVDRQEWLEALQIKLFDPAEATAKALSALEVPYHSVTNLDTLADLKSGVVIVGEGVAWDEYGELDASLLAAAERGVTVICLAPATAELHLPWANAGPTRISLRRNDVIRDLDKRFSLSWSANLAVDLRNLAIAAQGDTVVAKTVEAGRGWSWLEVHYGRPQARLIWCGLGLIRSWDESPTPRYVLLRLLESLSPDDLKPKTP